MHLPTAPNSIMSKSNATKTTIITKARDKRHFVTNVQHSPVFFNNWACINTVRGSRLNERKHITLHKFHRITDEYRKCEHMKVMMFVQHRKQIFSEQSIHCDSYCDVLWPT